MINLANKLKGRAYNTFRQAPWILDLALPFVRLTRARYTLGVVGVVINDAGQVLLVEHVFHPRFPWGLPGGWMKADETPGDALCREILEELDLIVSVKDVLVVGQSELRSHIDIAFLATPVSDPGMVSPELMGFMWHQVDQLPRLIAFHNAAITAYRKISGLEYQVI